MKKIAVVFETNFASASGMKNAVLNRVKALKAISDYEIDVFCIHYKYAGLNKIIRKGTFINPSSLDGVPIQTIWYNEYLIDDVLMNRLKTAPVYLLYWFKRASKALKDYDIVSAHGFIAGNVAYACYKNFLVPYFVTWHGSDIHSAPFASNYIKNSTINILNCAKCNFFVSSYLERVAHILSDCIESRVLYNGLSSDFYLFDKFSRHNLKIKYKCEKSKVVAFVGSLTPIKNVMLLPSIFANVKAMYKNKVSFWIIGDGYQRESLQSEAHKKGVDCTFMGVINNTEMPNVMNCIDVLVLPSQKESFGLVLIEAISCGANAVGSNTGGIPEVIGDNNVFDLGPFFIERISERIVEMLSTRVKQTVDDRFNWSVTARIEDSCYKRLFEA